MQNEFLSVLFATMIFRDWQERGYSIDIRIFPLEEGFEYVIYIGPPIPTIVEAHAHVADGIANLTAALRDHGYEVEVTCSDPPLGYWSDAQLYICIR